MSKKPKTERRSFSQKIGAIIQARMGSERLPGKSLMKVGEKPLLKHIIENLESSKYLDKIILATTELEEDKPLLELAESLNVSGFAGSENDVLLRYAEAAEKYKLNIVVRVTGDNILTDVDGMDKTIDLYLQEKPDIATNGGKQGYPLGSGVEVFSNSLLQYLNEMIDSPVEREHVTLHVHKRQADYRILYLAALYGYKDMNVRLTIDTKEDLSLIRILYEKIKESGEDFKLSSVMGYLKKHKELTNINSNIKQETF